MEIKEIANRLVDLCRRGEWSKAQKELYDHDAVSIEPYSTPGFEKEVKGLDALEEKGRKWDEMVEEMHGLEVSEPVIADNSFACTLRMDVTMKGKGRMVMTELCVYQVKDGKVFSEQFFM